MSGIWEMMELDSKVNSLSAGKTCKTVWYCLDEEKQSGNSWGLIHMLLLDVEKIAKAVHQGALNTELATTDLLFCGEM